MKYLLAIAMLFSIGWANAQESGAAEALIKEMAAKYKSYNSFFVKFKLTIDIPEESMDQYQEGEVHIADQKFRLDLGPQVILTDGKTTCTYMKDIKELQITDFEMDEEIMSPAELFTTYNEDFLYRLGESQSNRSTIEATPKDKSKSFFKVVVSVDTKLAVDHIKVFERNGTRYTYQVKELKTNPELPEDYFVCDQRNFPDAEVVEDLR